MHDLVIRGGTIIDGTGAAPRKGDVAIDGSRIAAVVTVPSITSEWPTKYLVAALIEISTP
jgi:N-acyl-D-aspartate/D-glutamate deacylase